MHDSTKNSDGAAAAMASKAQQAPVSLVCLPFAGAGASFFNDWVSLARPLTIVAPQLPGREKRFLEEPCRDVAEAITGILPDVLEKVSGSRVIVFGHSLGAVLAYELAHRLVNASNVQLEHLVVSGSPGPWTPRANRATGLEDQAFLDQVRQFAGYDHPALGDPELCEMLLPTLRADVEMHEAYYPPEDRLLDIPITVVRGSHDELVSREEAAQWQGATSLPLSSMEIAGGHMYLTEVPEKLLHMIQSLVNAGVAALADMAV